MIAWGLSDCPYEFFVTDSDVNLYMIILLGPYFATETLQLLDNRPQIPWNFHLSPL
jgi:hypothetical protein